MIAAVEVDRILTPPSVVLGVKFTCLVICVKEGTATNPYTRGFSTCGSIEDLPGVAKDHKKKMIFLVYSFIALCVCGGSQ